jgi:hypothetical protein
MLAGLRASVGLPSVSMPVNVVAWDYRKRKLRGVCRIIPSGYWARWRHSLKIKWKGGEYRMRVQIHETDSVVPRSELFGQEVKSVILDLLAKKITLCFRNGFQQEIQLNGSGLVFINE